MSNEYKESIASRNLECSLLFKTDKTYIFVTYQLYNKLIHGVCSHNLLFQLSPYAYLSHIGKNWICLFLLLTNFIDKITNVKFDLI